MVEIKLSHKESLAMKEILDKFKKSSGIIKLSFGLTSTTIEIESQFVADLMVSLKNLSKEWEKEKK